MNTYTPDNIELAVTEHRFSYPDIKPEQVSRLVGLRRMLKQAAVYILSECPCSYERDQALTSLETAAFWIEAAITRNE